MDALQIQEMNEVPYKSQNDGVMHACGHDNHMTGLLGVAMLLCERREEIARNGETDLPACGGDVSGWRIQRNAPFRIYG